MTDIKVFISYGRNDAAAFVDQLERDLQAAGIAVWRDTSDIRPGVTWDTEIVAAIKGSDLVVAILTPHSVRGGSQAATDASVCIDELRAARFDSPPTPIIPIMLVACEAPFIIARLNWIDFQRARNEPGQYQAALGALLKAIRDVKNGRSVALRTVAVEPLSFDLYLKEKTRDFVGRAWLIADVLERLTAPEATPALLLVGEAGWGKSAFAGHLYRTDPGGHLLAAHFCRADRVDSIAPRRFIESVAAMTALRLPPYADRLNGLLAAQPDLLSKDPVEMFERMFLEPLNGLDRTQLGPLPRCLLVDALDEAITRSAGSGLHSLLARSLPRFPDWLRLVATTRDAFGIVESFPGAAVIRLDHNDRRNRSDVTLLIQQRLAASSGGAGGGAPHDALLAAIEAKAQGNALVASQLAAAARRSGLAAETVRALPQGLTALYRILLERRFDPNGTDWAAVRAVLEMVITTDAPVPIALVASARGDADEYATRSAIQSISDLLSSHGDSIQLFHQTFREFLLERTHPFFVNPKTGATHLATAAAAPAPAPSLQSFGANRSHVTKRWIAESENPAEHANLLRNLYGAEFAQDFPLYNTPTDRDDLPDDMPLIADFIAAQQLDALFAVIAQAFASADASIERVLAGGTMSKPPARSSLEFAQAFQAAMWLANFGLIWIREIARLAPSAAPKLRELLSGAHVFQFCTFFGPALGYRNYEVSGYYETEADYLSAQYGKLWEELKQATTAPTVAARAADVVAPRPSGPASPVAGAPVSQAGSAASPARPVAPSASPAAARAGEPVGDLPTWLASSGEDFARYADVLAAWYETELARDDLAARRSFNVPLNDADRQAIARLAKGGRTECLARIADQAFAQAARSFEASGANTSRTPNFTAEQHRSMSAALSRACVAASFALDWCKAVADLGPDAGRPLQPTLENPRLGPFLYFLGWLELVDGCEVLKISASFEYEAASIRSRKDELSKKPQSSAPKSGKS